MDKHTVITDLKLATEVIGAETASLIEKYAEKKAAGDRSKVKASDALFVAGFKPEWCVSPFRAKNNIDPDTIAGEYLGAERTFGQLYDGLKVVLAHGYFSATAFELFMKDPKKLSRAESAARSEYVNAVGGMVSDTKASLIGKAKRAAKKAYDAEVAQEKLDAAKEDRAEKEVEKPACLKSSTVDDIVAHGQLATTMIKRCQNAEKPDYDSLAVIKLARDILGVIGVTDTTVEK